MSATMHFPGIEGVISGTFSIGHGIQPSVAVIEVLLSTRFHTRVGTLTLEDRDNNFFQEWRDCRIQKVQRTKNETYSVTILDRRWKWAFGGAFLLANDRDESGNVIGDHELRPQQVALKLLTDPPPFGLGEVNPDVGELPNDTFEEIRATGNPPAAELDALCQTLGCSITLWDDRVTIRRNGVGMRLPDTNPRKDASDALDIPLVPDGVSVVSGAYRVEAMFELEPVAEEVDGSLSNYNFVAYIPPNGWFEEWPRYFEGVAGEENRRLALKSVFRYYRIEREVGPGIGILDGARFGLFDRGQPVFVNNVDQILPTLPFTNQRQDQAGGTTRPQPATVRGVFYDGNDTMVNRAGFVRESFTYDPDRGLVIFNEPVFRLIGLADGHLHDAAELYLTVSVEVRSDSGQKLRHGVDMQTGERNNTPFQVEQRFDIIPQVTGEYTRPGIGAPPVRTGVTNNFAEIEPDMRVHAQAVVNSFQAPEAAMRTYVGWWDNMQLDGAIRQIVYQFNASGWLTLVSRNTEDPNFLTGNLADARRKTQVTTTKHERPTIKELMRDLGIA